MPAYTPSSYNGYIRLSSAPTLGINNPTCEACNLEVGIDNTGDTCWICPSCGSTWPISAEDGDLGTLDETATGPEIDYREAWRVAYMSEPYRHRQAKRIMDNIEKYGRANPWSEL